VVTVETDGVPCDAHDEIDPLGPVKVQVGVPVGATDPVTPVTVPVKVMICPLEVDD